MRVGSLFSGIGGLDLGFERAGMTVVWQSEIDPYASRVLRKHWPDVPNLGDVKSVDWSSVERPDLICGGYPCQPFSLAGRRTGADDPRHLWPYFAAALGVLRPEWALLENVPGHLSLGFGEVQSDLADLGYDTEWDLLPASAFGAPHLRYRLFCVAHAKGDTRGVGHGDSEVDVAHADSEQLRVGARSVPRSARAGEGQAPERQRVRADARDGGTTLPDTHGRRLQVGTQLDGEPQSDTTDGSPCGRHTHGLRDDVADADCSRQSVFQGRSAVAELARFRAVDCAGWWESEPSVGRVANGVPSRVDRLRGLGNAVVPQVAEWVGRRIMEAAA